jgi:3-oxoadipate enol-lactonase
MKDSTVSSWDLRYERNARCRTRSEGELYFETYGRGPALVLINNFFIIAPAWRNFTVALREEHQIIAYDLQNQGASTQPGPGFALSAHADDLIDLLDHLGVESAFLLGTSISTLIAREAALRYPDRVRGLILTGPIYSPFGSLRYRMLMRDWRGRLEAGGPRMLFDSLYPVVFSDRAVGEGDRAGYLGLRQRFLALNSHEQIAACLEAARVAERAADGSIGLDQQTLLMIGDGDPFWSASTLAAACETQSDARGVVIPDAGHLPFVEQPRAFEAGILEFLRPV